jgi:hypothetical protein
VSPDEVIGVEDADDVSVDPNEDCSPASYRATRYLVPAKMIRPLPSSPKGRSRILDGF